MFFFELRISSASLSNSGAITISINMPFIISAVFLSTGLFSAIIPPNIDVLSLSYAFLNASLIFSPLAIPQGFPCFTATAVGSSKSFKISIALLLSPILLKDNSLPCSCLALEIVPSRSPISL